MNYLKNLKWEMIVFSLGCIGIGILLCFFPKSTTSILAGAVAAIMFVYAIRHFLEFFRRTGMEKVYKYELVMGVVFAILGVIALTQMDKILSFISYFIAILVFISGLMKIENAIDLKRMNKHWITMMVIGILFMVLSIIIFIAPMNDDTGKKTAGDIILITSGAVLMFVGVVNLITTLVYSSKIKVWTKEQSSNADVVDVEYEEVNNKEIESK